MDLNGDGRADARGNLGPNGTEIPYRFTEAGIYSVIVTFSQGQTSTTDTLFVVANDPGVAVATQSVERPPLPRHYPQGLAVVEGSLFATYRDSLHRWNPVSLVLERSVGFDTTGFGQPVNLHALAVSRDGQLFAINSRRPEVFQFFLSDPREFQTIIGGPTGSSGLGRSYVSASFEGKLIIGGNSRIIVVDRDHNQIIAERVFLEGGHFAAGPLTSRLAIAQWNNRIRLVDASSLADEWVLELDEDFHPKVVAFSPDETVVYALGYNSDGIRFLAISIRDSRVMRDMMVSDCQARENCFSNMGGNPSVTRSRFAIMVSSRGSFMIDGDLHLPRYRLNAPGHAACCNVAVSADGRTIYFGGNNRLASMSLPFPL